MEPSDLTADVFCILRNMFFDANCSPKSFPLRMKSNTQDDPLDEYIAKALATELKDAVCQKAPGPLVSPDIVIYRHKLCERARRNLLVADPSRIFGLEVKKLERSAAGRIARSTGLDYNTTPPCGTIRVYEASGEPLDIRGFYLFVCQGINGNDIYSLSSLALCDGNILNEDFEFYLSITSQREKEVNLGTYGDGANRNRPMLIFSNPLGAPQLDNACTLVTNADLLHTDSRLRLVYRIFRTTQVGEQRMFYAYRSASDVARDWVVQDIVDPFPQPTGRVSTTQSRGKFRLQFRACK